MEMLRWGKLIPLKPLGPVLVYHDPRVFDQSPEQTRVVATGIPEALPACLHEGRCALLLSSCSCKLI
jgi:hypothetical protein